MDSSTGTGLTWIIRIRATKYFLKLNWWIGLFIYLLNTGMPHTHLDEKLHSRRLTNNLTFGTW